MLSFLWLLIASPAAWAGDFDVAYAVELDGKRVTGTLDNCVYGKVCFGNIHAVDFDISLSVDKPQDTNAKVTLHGRRCCFFHGGVVSQRLDLTQKLMTLPLYEGKRRRGMEMVWNVQVGILHLAIVSLRGSRPIDRGGDGSPEFGSP